MAGEHRTRNKEQESKIRTTQPKLAHTIERAQSPKQIFNYTVNIQSSIIFIHIT